MPWKTPTLKDTRKMTRDYVLSQLGAKAMIPNSVLRIMSDGMAGLAHLVLLYIDWLSKQLLPDTAEHEWLDRHGNIWLRNADGSIGRKAATYAQGEVLFTGTEGTIVPAGFVMTGTNSVEYQTVTETSISLDGGSATAVALTAGTVGNIPAGETLGFTPQDTSLTGTAVLLTDMTGGTNGETDEQLRERILFRIQNPPMGGDAADYVAWTLAIPGVTRAWCYPNEMGIGTVTVRFMMDDLRVSDKGIPSPADVDMVAAALDLVRPVAVKDFYVLAPVPFLVDYMIRDLEPDTEAVRAAIYASMEDMFFRRGKPGQTMYKSWAMEAISQAVSEDHHDLDQDNIPMPSVGHMPLLGVISYG